MLHDADASLACWLARVLPGGTKVGFCAPDPRWAARPPDPPLVGAFLYDVREDGQPNAAGWSPVRDGDGTVTGRQRPTRHYTLRYLLTAWAGEAAPPLPGDGAPPAGGGDTSPPDGPARAEHELLGALLCACAATDTLPAECLRGTLAAAGLPVLLRCAPPDGDAAARLWAGFGLPPRTFLDLLLIVPVLPPPEADLAPPVRQITLDVRKPGTAGSQGTGDAGDITSGAGTAGAPAVHLPGQRRRPQAPGSFRERTSIIERIIRPDGE